MYVLLGKSSIQLNTDGADDYSGLKYVPSSMMTLLNFSY